MRAKNHFLSLICVVLAFSLNEHARAANYRFETCMDAYHDDIEAKKYNTVAISISQRFNRFGLGPWETSYHLGLIGPWMIWEPRKDNDDEVDVSKWAIFRLHHYFEQDSLYGDNYLITGVPCFLGEDFPLHETTLSGKTALFEVTHNRIYKDHNHSEVTEILTLWHPLVDGQIIFGIRNADPGPFLFRKLRDHCRVHCKSRLSDFFKRFERPQ